MSHEGCKWCFFFLNKVFYLKEKHICDLCLNLGPDNPVGLLTDVADVPESTVGELKVDFIRQSQT